jgi:hypothetical protein
VQKVKYKDAIVPIGRCPYYAVWPRNTCLFIQWSCAGTGKVFVDQDSQVMRDREHSCLYRLLIKWEGDSISVG